MASAIASTPGGYQAYSAQQQSNNRTNLYIILAIVLAIVVIVVVFKMRSGYENVGVERITGRKEEVASNEMIQDLSKYSRF